MIEISGQKDRKAGETLTGDIEKDREWGEEWTEWKSRSCRGEEDALGNAAAKWMTMLAQMLTLSTTLWHAGAKSQNAQL